MSARIGGAIVALGAEAYAAGRITDEAKFEAAANQMLDACAVFWEGLDATRRGEEYKSVPEGATKFGI